MDRRVKVGLALVLVLGVTIVGVTTAASPPTLTYTNSFTVHGMWDYVDEEVHNFTVGWPYWQFKVVVNVTEMVGGYPNPSLVRDVDIYRSPGFSSPGHLMQHLEISEVGIRSTNWITAGGYFNITIRAGHDYALGGGGFSGQVSVYCRGWVYVILYGESDS